MKSRMAFLFPVLAGTFISAALIGASAPAFAQVGAIIQWNPPREAAPPSAAVPPPPAPSGSERDLDYRQLDEYASEYAAIDKRSSNASHASKELANLGRRVAAFHRALVKRDYNAQEILNNTDALQKRIAGSRAKLAQAASPPHASPTDATPPGTSIGTQPEGTQPEPPPEAVPPQTFVPNGAMGGAPPSQ